MDARNYFQLCRKWTWSRFCQSLQGVYLIWVSIHKIYILECKYVWWVEKFEKIFIMDNLYHTYAFECRQNQELVKQLSSPFPGSKDLHFQSHFPQNGWEQFKACLWKQHLSYWRSPSYNLMRIFFVTVSSLLFGVLFWKQGKKMLVNFSLLMLM